MLVPDTNQLNRARMLHFLDELEITGSTARSLYLPPDSPVPETEKTLAGMLPAEPLSLISAEFTKSKTGIALFWGEQRKVLARPPFPIKENRDANGYDVGPLRSLLLPDRTIALVLVRLGEYAIGVFHGEKLLSSKIGSGNVHQRHRQGGSSAHRFERHRDKQIEYFFDRICTHAREHIAPHASQLDYVVYGGTRFTVQALRQQCKFLQLFDDRTSGLLLNVRQPRQATLEAAINEVYASKIIEWQEG